jgi:hypothetical protein
MTWSKENGSAHPFVPFCCSCTMYELDYWRKWLQLAKHPPGIFHGTQTMRAAGRSRSTLALEPPYPVRWQVLLLFCLPTVTYFIIKSDCRMYGMLIIATCVTDRTYSEKVKFPMMQHRRGNGNREDLTGWIYIDIVPQGPGF